MPDPQPLPRPPIVEAILNVRILPQIESDALNDAVTPALSKLFSGRRDRTVTNTTLSSDGAVTSQSSIDGVLLDMADRSRTLLIGRSEFGLSALKGAYPGWEAFLGEFQGVWAEFHQHRPVECVTRISTRFINRIRVPLAGLDLDDYFQIGLRVPPRLPQQLAGFSVREQVPIRDGLMVLINFVSAGQPTETDLELLLDIDTKMDLDGLQVEDDAIWQHFNELRGLKNEAFFGSVTERLLEVL